MTRLDTTLLLLATVLAATAVVARAACDPHPMERIDLYPDRSSNPLLGPDSCQIRANSATTATLQCIGSSERVYHLTWVQP